MREILKVADALDAIREINAIGELGYIDIYPALNVVCLGIDTHSQITKWFKELGELIGWTELRFDITESQGSIHYIVTCKCGNVRVEITHIEKTHAYNDDGSDPGNCSVCHFFHK